jgi:hypothetical protein
MCRERVSLIALVLVLSLAGDVRARLIQDPSIVLYYSFDAISDIIADQSVNGHDGVIVGDITLDPAGISEGAAKFAQGSYIDLNGPSIPAQDIPRSGMTLAAWAKCENTGGDHAIFNARASDSTWLIHPELRSSGQFRWLLRAAGGTTIFDIRAGEVTWDEWLHYAGLYDKASGTASLYINGEVVQEQAVTNAPNIAGDWGGGARVGYNVDNARPFTGLMDIFCIFKRALSPGEIQEVMLGIPAGVAYEPIPEHEDMDVSREVVLSWAPGKFAATHNVYLSTSQDEVEAADASALVGDNLDASNLDMGRLAFDQTYFWRVDEVNAAPDNTVFTGDIWSFTIEPKALAVETIKATASTANPNMGPEKTIDGSGLDATDAHSATPNDMWLGGGTSAWIQYEFDKAYKVHQMLVWNSNQAIETFLGFGIKDVTVETSIDGQTWTAVAGVSQFAQATGLLSYTANTRVDFGDTMAKHVKITGHSAYGFAGQMGLSEVRFLYIPTFARGPQPVDQGISTGVNVQLSWRSGREAASHQVFLGTDPANLALAGTPDDSVFVTEGLDYAHTYYWQVVEVNEVEAPSTYSSDIWSFTTPDFGVIDGFESYTGKEGQEVFMTWLDGYGGDESLGGSTTGYAEGPFVETTSVNPGTGGSQSMPIFYDNDGNFATIDGKVSSPTFSEVVRKFDSPQDWTAGGINALSLFFHGQTGNTGQLYLKINDTKILIEEDAIDLAQGAWQPWTIGLETVGANLTNVTSLTIGVQGNSTSGMLIVDDIRVYAHEN